MTRKALLVVDDNSVVRDVIKSTFDADYCVFEASTFSDAMKIPPQSLNLAIVDHCLPDGNGFDVLRSLRVRDITLPVIMITGYGSEELIIKALRQNVTDYMKKPLNLHYLRKRVSEILRDNVGKNDEAVPYNKDRHLDNVARYIQLNYMEEITLDKLSRIACMSRFSFSRAFKEKFKQCCVSYLNTVRLNNAGELLKTSTASITEIAFLVGYRNSGHFNRAFKAAYKISPKAYRRSF